MKRKTCVITPIFRMVDAIEWRDNSKIQVVARNKFAA
jgi:hypothetical protein